MKKLILSMKQAVVWWLEKTYWEGEQSRLERWLAFGYFTDPGEPLSLQQELRMCQEELRKLEMAG